MVKEDKDGDSFWNILLGIGLGIIGYSVFSQFIKPRCPVCNHKVEPRAPKCSRCGSELIWKEKT